MIMFANLSDDCWIDLDEFLAMNGAVVNTTASDEEEGADS